MKIESTETGYILTLSADETETWAHRPGASWPCSTLSGWAIVVEVDDNGLCGIGPDATTSNYTKLPAADLSTPVAGKG